MWTNQVVGLDYLKRCPWRKNTLLRFQNSGPFDSYNYSSNLRGSMMTMKDSLRTGFCFGLTSGIITTLGLMVGLNSGTGSKLAVIGGILTIAVADAFSDALGIHISEESENAHSTREVWESTVFTFVSKFLVAMTFIVPVLLFDLSKAILASLIWGFLVLGILSFFLARGQERNPWKVVAEHLIILMVVVIATDLVGSWIGTAFG